MKYLEELNKMSVGQFLLYYRNLSFEDKINLIKNQEILKLTDEKFNIVVLNSNEDEIKVLIDNEELYDKLLNLSPQMKNGKAENIKKIVLDKPNVKRTVLNILEENKPNILKLIIESPYAAKYSDKFKEFILYLSLEKVNRLSETINLDNIIGNILSKENLKTYLINKLTDVGEEFDDLFELFMTKINNKQIDPILIFKLENYKQFILLSKFGMLIEMDYDKNYIMLPSNLILPYEAIINVKDKYITKLIELLKQKGDTESYKYLEVALKLYFIFGFDDAKKVLDDKFSKLNESSLIRIVDFSFKDFRREYRAKNQNKFYFYGMEQIVIASLAKGNSKIFEDLLFYPTIEEVEALENEFLSLVNEYKDKKELIEKIKEKLCDKISEREKKAKDKLYNEIKKRIDEKIINYKKVDTDMLFELLKNVNLYQLTEEYDAAMLEKLGTFLLGNKKSNNDCLLRLILNGEAFGLNRNFATLVNNFDLLTAVTYSDNLSLNSILDIIDILKMNLYELKPNEQDITLETLTRVINSTEYKTDNGVDVAKEICRIHVERKNKTFSTIPTVSGKTEEFEYFVAPFDAEYLLAAGNDSRNCMRVSGLGQDFFEYCLKNKNAVMIYLIDKDGEKYICPTIRSGNAISCNGIDPVIPIEKRNNVLKALSSCFEDIIKSSYNKNRNHYENIEIATLTDLHLKEYFESSNIEKYDLEKPLPLDEPCYCDYNKKEITHYVLAKSSTYTSNHYYISNDEYYQKRDQDYEFDVNKEYDKERLNLIINSIYYSSIDHQNIFDKEKIRRKREFQPLYIESFKYIIGNKDWFVAIDNNYNIISCLLPYDKRAKANYFKAVAAAPGILEKLIGDNYGGKNL